MIQKLRFCWGRISVCHSPSTMLPCLQKGSGTMPRGDILNIKQRRATQSSFRSHKYCVFCGQDPCCTFNIPLRRIPCNCHVPVSKLWPISDQRQAGEVAEQFGMAIPWGTSPNDKMQADTLMWGVKVAMATASQGQADRGRKKIEESEI